MGEVLAVQSIDLWPDNFHEWHVHHKVLLRQTEPFDLDSVLVHIGFLVRSTPVVLLLCLTRLHPQFGIVLEHSPVGHLE